MRLQCVLLADVFVAKGYSRKKYLGGEDGRQYIFLWVVGAESFQIIWAVGAESFQIIWAVGVRPNLITWQIPTILDDIKLCKALNI